MSMPSVGSDLQSAHHILKAFANALDAIDVPAHLLPELRHWPSRH